MTYDQLLLWAAAHFLYQVPENLFEGTEEAVFARCERYALETFQYTDGRTICIHIEELACDANETFDLGV
jgi:hypothetical protein